MEGRRMLRISFVFSWYHVTNGLGSAYWVSGQCAEEDDSGGGNRDKALED
jgi:hypothetical protein